MKSTFGTFKSLKRHDSWEAHGWLRTDINGLYYRSVEIEIKDPDSPYQGLVIQHVRYIYVWHSSNYGENEEEIKLLPDGKFEVVGWEFDDRENRFDSLQDAVKNLPPTLKNWTD